MALPSWLDLLIGRRLRALGTAVTRRTNLNFGTGFTVTDDPANDMTTVTTSGGGGSGDLVVSTQSALKALVRADLTDGQKATVKATNQVWIWSATTGAGIAGDDKTTTQLTEGVIGDAGRFYNSAGAPIVATVAAVRAATAGIHETISAQNHTSAGDGGGDLFDKRSGTVTDDNGSQVQPPGASFHYARRFNGYYTPQMFGAQQGGADDYTAILAAWNAFLSNKRGRLHFPFGRDGTYAIGTTWLLEGNGFTAARITGDCGNIFSGASGVQIKWIGASSGTAVHMRGVTGVRWEHVDINCNNLAKIGMQVEGKQGVQGTSDVLFEQTMVYNPIDVSGAECWAIGNATGYQCDNIKLIHCAAFAAPSSVNITGFNVRGSANTKDIIFEEIQVKYCWRGIVWATSPSGRALIAHPSFTGVPATGTGGAVGACVVANDGNLLIHTANQEGCAGRFLISTAAGSAIGSVEVQHSQLNCACPAADDVIISYQAGFLKLTGNYMRNLRESSPGVDAAAPPKVVVNSGYGYANTNGYGLISEGNHFVHAAGDYIPVVDEGGNAILTAGALASAPAPITSFGDTGSTAFVPAKFKPIIGRMPDLPQFGTGLLQTSAVGAVSASSGTNGDIMTWSGGAPTWATLTAEGAVPATRTLTGSGAIKIAGDNSAHDLSEDRTISIADATSGAVGAMAFGGDLNGTGTTALAPRVGQLTGVASSVAMLAAAFTWAQDVAPTFAQTARTGDNAAQDFSHVLQAPSATATSTRRNSPSATWNIPAPTSGGTDGSFLWQHRGVQTVSFARDRLIMGNTTTVTRTDYQNASGGLFVWTVDAANLLVMNASGAAFTVNVQADASQATPIWGQATKTGGASTTGQLFTFHAQDNTDTTSIGGSLRIRPGSGTSTGGTGAITTGGAVDRITWADGTVSLLSDATTIKTSGGGATLGSFAPATVSIGNTTAVTTLELALKNDAATTGFFGTPFTQFQITSPAVAMIWANGSPMLRSNGSGVYIGGNVDATRPLEIGVAGTTKAVFDADGNLRLGDGTAPTHALEINRGGGIWFDPTQSTPVITQGAPASANGQAMIVAAQPGGGSNKDGGSGSFLGGAATGVGLSGSAILACGDGGAYVQSIHIGENQHIVALCRAGGLTSTQMPGSTGDQVIYIANAATVPSANPVGGGILYVDAGTLKYRGPSGTVTPLGLP